MARAFEENPAPRRELSHRLSTRLARAALRAVGPTLEARSIGNALLVHPRGFVDNRALAFSQRLAADPQHTLVVLDLPARPEDDVWETVARALDREGRSFRLVPGRGTREDVQRAAQWLADRLDRMVLAPDGALVPAAGGALFVPAHHGLGWLRYRPHMPSAPDSRRFPKPQWEYAIPDQPWSTGSGSTAEPLPGGVWIRGSWEDAATPDHRQRLVELLAGDPELLGVALGTPGSSAPLALEDIAAFWETLPSSARHLVRFVSYGPVAVPEGAPLGQALADVLGAHVAVYAGLPSAGAEPGSREVRTLQADGTLGWRPYADEFGYTPRGPNGEPAVAPMPLNTRTPTGATAGFAPGIYQHAPDVLLEVVQSGLWVRPTTEPRDGQVVRSAPADPAFPALLYDQTDPDLADRMRTVAYELLPRLEPAFRDRTRVLPSTEAGRMPAGGYPPPAIQVLPGTAQRASLSAPGRPEGRVPQERTGAQAPLPAPRQPADWTDEAPAAGGAPGRPAASDPSPAAPPLPGRLDAGPAQPVLPPVPTMRPVAPPVPSGPPTTPVTGPATTGTGPADPVTPLPDPPVPTSPGPATPPAAPVPPAGPGPQWTPQEPQAAPPAGRTPVIPLTPVTPAGPVSPFDPRPPAPADPAPADPAPEGPAPGPAAPPADPAPQAGPAPQADLDPGAPPTAPAPAADPAPPAAAPPGLSLPSIRLESSPTQPPSPTPPPAPRREDSAPQPPTGPEAPPVPEPSAGPAAPPAEAAVPAEEAVAPPAQPPAAAPGTVRVQPEPSAAAGVLPPAKGVDRERDWVRRSLGERYDTAAALVARVLSQSPGLAGGPRASAGDALTDLSAMRLYLTGATREIDAAIRSATAGPHVPLARCATAGMRRLPSYRGGAILRATLNEEERAWYREGRLLTEHSFLSALSSVRRGLRGNTDLLFWSLTARRTGLLAPEVPDRLLFTPGTRFKVLRSVTGERPAVLLRELASPEVDEAGNLREERGPLDEIALTGLDQLHALWKQAEAGAEVPVGDPLPDEYADAFCSAPGLLQSRPGWTAGSRPPAAPNTGPRRGRNQ
ncbi:hypothetical protein ACFV3R_00495 [Streptomyces sp. NPDC059740]|uniref:hypothetical protein n=1 Tax=Streptomyces sp. NPDC059740 TaxID=3346926 RepID=UPI00364F2235